MEVTDRRASTGGKTPPPSTPVTRGDIFPDVKPNLRHLSMAAGVPFEEWAKRDNAHRAVLRQEMLSVLKVFIGPLQDALLVQHRLITELRRPWYEKLWHWLRSPVQQHLRPSPSPVTRGDAQGSSSRSAARVAEKGRAKNGVPETLEPVDESRVAAVPGSLRGLGG